MTDENLSRHAAAALVALYNGEGGCGVIEKHTEDRALVHFLDGAKVWCATRNLTPCRHNHGYAMRKEQNR